MTTARFCKEKKGYSVSITGHAAYAPEGIPDIVCASCSTLTYVLLQQLLKAENEGKLLRMQHEIDPITGDFQARFEPQKSAVREIYTILDVIMDGFALLENTYPENVALKWGETEKGI